MAREVTSTIMKTSGVLYVQQNLSREAIVVAVVPYVVNL